MLHKIELETNAMQGVRFTHPKRISPSVPCPFFPLPLHQHLGGGHISQKAEFEHRPQRQNSVLYLLVNFPNAPTPVSTKPLLCFTITHRWTGVYMNLTPCKHLLRAKVAPEKLLQIFTVDLCLALSKNPAMLEFPVSLSKTS